MPNFVTDFVVDTWSTLRAMNFRQLLQQVVSLGAFCVASRARCRASRSAHLRTDAARVRTLS
jgi:hypothetical protein